MAHQPASFLVMWTTSDVEFEEDMGRYPMAPLQGIALRMATGFCIYIFHLMKHSLHNPTHAYTDVNLIEWDFTPR